MRKQIMSRLWNAVTPFSGIDLDPSNLRDMTSVEVMGIPMEQAMLVIRGVVDGQEVEIQVGELGCGGRDGIALIHTQEHEEIHDRYMSLVRLSDAGEYRLLVDCEMKPDTKSGVAFTLRVRDVNS